MKTYLSGPAERKEWMKKKGSKRDGATSRGETGVIEVDLFSKDVNSLDHPKVIHFRGLLEEVAEQYRCSIVTFKVDHGTVFFSFDDDVLTAEILKILRLGPAA